MQELLAPENLLNPVLVKRVRDIEVAEKAQMKGTENAQEQDGQQAGKQQKQEPQQQTAVTDVSRTKKKERAVCGR